MRDDIKYLKSLIEVERARHIPASAPWHLGWVTGRIEMLEDLIRLLCPHKELRKGRVLPETGGPHVICAECGQRYL